tara:strand:- start:613 stop:801 length:189 start_codon:yes stop_codon:yes gene_type:complete
MDTNKIEYLKQNPKKQLSNWWNIPFYNPILGCRYNEEINRVKSQTKIYTLDSMQEYATSNKK